MRLLLPEKVQYIIEKLNQGGFEAYAVGGCVRDSILGRTPDDWDITTSARPQQVKALFDRTVDTGLQHGTVTVLLNRDSYEVTTYRIDGEYLDGRHPERVAFTSRLEEDLRRRDFTINAMAYSQTCGLVDCFQGLEDIRLRRVRCVGKPQERFSEDALRILRAVRFSAQLGFSIEEKTREAVKQLAPALKKISAERIRAELNKILLSERPEKLREAWELGITAVVLPELDLAMSGVEDSGGAVCTDGERALRAAALAEPRTELRWALLLQGLGKAKYGTGVSGTKGLARQSEELAAAVLRRLKFDNETIRRVRLLVRWQDEALAAEAAAVRRAVSAMGREMFSLYLKARRAALLAGETESCRERLEELERVGKLFQESCERGECVALKELAVGGRELMELGAKPGPGLGELLAWLLELVLERPERNNRDYLLGMAAEKLKKG